MWREFNRNSMEDIRLLESICRNSGSPSVKKEAAYIRRAIYLTKDKPQNLWCWIYNDCAFYMCTRCKKHIRGILTVVRADMHRKGLGRLVNNHRLVMMTRAGIDTFKFRTNQNEEAVKFWTAQGARIVDVNGNDYEMELKIIL